MSSDYTELNTYRYERKFVTQNYSRLATELIIKQNSAFFSSVYHPRRINNIYFDTPGLDCFFDNLFGNAVRWKARIRWYGKKFGEINNPRLEFKLKKGLTGTKKSFLLPSFEIDKKDFDTSFFYEYFEMANLPDEVKDRMKKLQPVLINSYRRSYFVSINQRYRVTVDDNLEYYNLRSGWNIIFPHPFKEIHKTVVELKYDQEWNDEAEQITNQFPFRLDKNSKFVAGMRHFRSEIAE